MKRGVISKGIVCPIVREGDNVVDIVIDSLLKETKVFRNYVTYSDEPEYDINDKDVIGITESLVARSAGLYVTVDDIAEDIKSKYGEDTVISVIAPIYSRNRFAMILKGVARAAKKIMLVMPDYDEVGNPRGVNPFTGVNIEEYYKELCEAEGCECTINEDWGDEHYSILDCRLHREPTEKPEEQIYWRLDEICADKNPDFGLLGTNKATEERLKLFPTRELADKVCEEVKAKIKEKLGKNVIVLVYGDGCFKDPVGGIWEFADPVTCPGYTDKELLESTPKELKLKAMIDLNPVDNDEIENRISAYHMPDINAQRTGSMGTTPRVYKDLLASLMDLTSGSGDRATPVVLVQNYF